MDDSSLESEVLGKKWRKTRVFDSQGEETCPDSVGLPRDDIFLSEEEVVSEDWDFHLLPEALELNTEFTAACRVRNGVLLSDSDTGTVVSHEYAR